MPNGRGYGRLAVQIGISVFALYLLIAQLSGYIHLDTIALGLAGIVVLPWLSAILRSAKLPGGLEFDFTKVIDEQARQGKELYLLRFLVENFVTGYELTQLEKLASGAPFPFTPQEPFKNELRRLINYGLLSEIPNANLERDFYKVKDIREIVTITGLGREYLTNRQSLQSSE